MKLTVIDHDIDLEDILEGNYNKISVNGNVNFQNSNIENIPVIFDKVTGNFDCQMNMKLTSLKNCPNKINGNFIMTKTKIQSFEDAPKEVDGDVNFSHLKISSFMGCPQKIGGSLIVDVCHNLTSLKGCPVSIGKDFICNNNEINSFEGCPQFIGGNFDISHNKLTSLSGIHKYIKQINGNLSLVGNQIVEGGIGLILIDGIKKISFPNPAFKIITKYLGKGKKGLLLCQEELIEAGYEEFTKL